MRRGGRTIVCLSWLLAVLAGCAGFVRTNGQAGKMDDVWFKYA